MFRYFELVEPHGPRLFFFLSSFLPFVLLPPRDEDNLYFLGFNLPKSLARDGGLRIY